MEQAVLDKLQEISGGLLTKKSIRQLSLPNSDTVNTLAYLATRLKPVMPKYRYESVGAALAAIEQHFKYHAEAGVTARICNRSDRAIEALLLSDETKQSVVVNPWTYAAEALSNG